VYPNKHSHPQSEVDTPPFKQVVGTQSESESEEHPKKKIKAINMKIDFNKDFEFFIIFIAINLAIGFLIII
jgi:hypothetical protein